MKLLNKGREFETTYNGRTYKIPKGEFNVMDELGHFLVSKIVQWELDISIIEDTQTKDTYQGGDPYTAYPRKQKPKEEVKEEVIEKEQITKEEFEKKVEEAVEQEIKEENNKPIKRAGRPKKIK